MLAERAAGGLNAPYEQPAQVLVCFCLFGLFIQDIMHMMRDGFGLSGEITTNMKGLAGRALVQ